MYSNLLKLSAKNHSCSYSNQKYPLLVLLRFLLKIANSFRSRLMYSGSCIVHTSVTKPELELIFLTPPISGSAQKMGSWARLRSAADPESGYIFRIRSPIFLEKTGSDGCMKKHGRDRHRAGSESKIWRLPDLES